MLFRFKRHLALIVCDAGAHEMQLFLHDITQSKRTGAVTV